MRILSLTLLCVVLSCGVLAEELTLDHVTPPAPNSADEPLAEGFEAGRDGDGFVPLFNGQDLTGWVRTNTPVDTWKVQDGMLVCSGKPIGEIRTERMYQNFILELEWRHMLPRGNAGVFIWADDITARGVPFHRAIEVQVLENAYGNSPSHTTHGDIFPIHGATMTPLNGRGGSRAFPTAERSLPSPQWNHYRITCQDGEISLAVNGQVVTQGQDCSPRRGYICLESEGGIVHYRNLRIQKFPDTAIDEGQVAIADRGFRSLYTGLDLAGWTGEPDATRRWHANDWVLACDGPQNEEEVTLGTVERFGDVGVVFDVRFRDGGKPLRTTLRGALIDTEDESVARYLEPSGRWNRFEATLRGTRLTLAVNGHEAITEQATEADIAPGGLEFSPAGPVELANIYVRELSADK